MAHQSKPAALRAREMKLRRRASRLGLRMARARFVVEPESLDGWRLEPKPQPIYTYAHLDVIEQYLDAAERGEIDLSDLSNLRAS